MTSRDFRRIALGMTDAVEGAHMEHPDFRVNGRIFATLQPGSRRGMVKLTPEQQQDFFRIDPIVFEAEPGAWGRQGCTRVRLDLVDEDKLGNALTLAWQNAAKRGAASAAARMSGRRKPGRMAAAAGAPKRIDEYLAALSDDKRATLEKLRRDIQAAAPRAEECISYGIPAFRLEGKLLVHFGAATRHCAFYPGAIIEAFQTELRSYSTSKGTIRFPPDRPLPSALVRRLVRARIASHAASR